MYGRTDTITRNNEPLFKFVLWLERGSILQPFYRTERTEINTRILENNDQVQ